MPSSPIHCSGCGYLRRDCNCHSGCGRTDSERLDWLLEEGQGVGMIFIDEETGQALTDREAIDQAMGGADTRKDSGQRRPLLEELLEQHKIVDSVLQHKLAEREEASYQLGKTAGLGRALEIALTTRENNPFTKRDEKWHKGYAIALNDLMEAIRKEMKKC